MRMAEVVWTPAQHDAIYAKGGTILVSAAAGSGKTAVLVRRVIEKLTDAKNPCSVDELLIVTFTKAAAAQMRDKISREISKMINSEEDIKKKSYLLRQQMLLKCAKISTIDSFCGDVVRNNVQAIPLDSDYKLIDESSMKAIMDTAYEEVAEEFYQEGDGDFLVLADMFTKSNDDKMLKELVFSLYDFSCSYMKPEKWIKKIDRKLLNDKTDYTNPYAQTVINCLREDIDYCRTLARKAYSIAVCDDATAAAYGPAVKDDMDLFENLLEKMKADFSEEDWDEISQTALSLSFSRLGTIKAASKCDESNAVKMIRDYYKDYYKKATSVVGIYSDDNRQDIKSLAPVMKMLSRFTLAFFDRLNKLKIEKNCADFSDVLHMALDLLVEEKDGKIVKTDLAKEYAEQFKEILIDEYQDTNEAQDVLFHAVSRNGENLFYVGDVKQSIYGFRKAMPEIFLKKRKEFADYNSENPVFPATITLDKNFRSRKDVTDFVNFTFCRLMSEGAGEIEYDNRETLKPGASYDETDEPCCCVHILEKSAFEETDSSFAQAVHIAQEIKAIKEKGRFDFKDMAILLRTKKNMPLFVQVLNDSGVSAYADESENLFETIEVRTILSFIKVIDNPARDIPLLATMMSPIFGFTADELSDIRIENKGGSFYSAVKTSADKGNERCKNFLNVLSSYRLIAQTVTPGELVRHILLDTSYKSIVLAMDRGSVREENLDIFRSFADSYSAENDVGLSGFVRQVEKFEKSSAIKSASSASSNENSVAIMTIHRSKGLEFPVCFMAEAEKEFSKRSYRDDLLSHPQGGVGIIGIDTNRMIKYETLSRTAVRIDKEKTDLSENMRVLYVAMTRAKEKLVIVAAPKNFSKTLQNASVMAFGEKMIPSAIRNASSYLDWLTAVILRHPDADWLRVKTGAVGVSRIDADFPLEIKIIKELPSLQEGDKKEEHSEKADSDYLEKIKKDIEYIYPYSALADVMAKRGASAVTKKTVDREYFASDRPAFLNKTALTAAGRGTAMHLFMQFADYSGAKENLEKEIERLQEKGFLTEVQAKSLDRKKLNGFFNSSLFERIMKSDTVYKEKKFIIAMSPCEFDENLSDTFADERIIVQGILDCAFEENGEIVIVDYKTDRVSSPEQLRERYSDQLRVYERAVKECLGKNVKETLLYSFSLETTVQI